MKHEEPEILSVLVAARNESENISFCIDALLRQKLPPNKKLEILVGNDASEDNTLQILQKYSHSIRVFDIKEKLGSAKGKANVLAHLARKAKGDYFLITDADTQVPETWADRMSEAAKLGNADIVTGVTYPEGQKTLDRLQAAEWLSSLFIVFLLYKRKKPITTMGNNMLVRRRAYESVGGYEKLPFSLTEDYQLFNELIIKSFRNSSQNESGKEEADTTAKRNFVQLFEPAVTALTKPAPSLRSLINQRRRWFYGVLSTGLFGKVLTFISLFLIPFICALFIFAPYWGIAFLLMKFGVRCILIRKSEFVNSKPFTFLEIVIFDFFIDAFYVVMIVFYFLKPKIQWKGRSFSRKKP